MTPLISVGALAERIPRGSVRLLDVRWRLDAPEGRVSYVSAHLPGAVYVDLEHELAQRGHPELGSYPPPTFAQLERSVRRWGIDQGDVVVAYDDNDGVPAARAWWLLRRQGFEVRVLDGGLRAWVAEGLPIEQGDVAPPPGNAQIADVDPGVASIDDAARAPRRGFLVDVRSPEHYRGRVSGRDPVAGHIPGAINLPTVAHISSIGTLKSAEEIRATVAAAGIDARSDIVLYCGTGIASAHSALALASAGIETRIFTGSWSQWALLSSRPVAVGSQPAAALRGA
ncbi:sulfurtransferase [Microbacterium rhizomatis]|uniref:Sulfurtransferase n=1 Tax=Microbacterium rhizomatis TaxID=1631477 RepID=A0A5J5J9F5_9MICO|nr:sulfurtransferase [Microbacterium rhizomatis]KAA9111433.1 sulfurtransferase [Microbacterium rhizomatis]